MSLKPYWVKHPVQLRLTAFGFLLTLPVWILAFVVHAAWKDREEVVDFGKTLWDYMIKGGE